jgi:NTE family protein
VDGGIADLVPIAGAAALSPTRVFVLDASVPPRMPHARTPVEVLVASLGVAMRARPMVDLGPGVEVHHLRTDDLGTRMTDFSRTAEHLALGRRAAAVLLDRLAHAHETQPVRPTPRHARQARHHRLRDIFGRAA